MKLVILTDESGRSEQIDLKALDRLDRVRKTEHYVFRYTAGSLAEKEIDTIAETQESCYSDLVSLFGFAAPAKIEYLLLDSPVENGAVLSELTGIEQGRINGFSIGPNYVFAAYCDEGRCIGHHEVTHIFSYQLCMPKSQFLSEGLAMYTDGAYWGKPNMEWVRIFLENGSYVPIGQLANDEVFCVYPTEITYPISGAFVAFLIQRLGAYAFLHAIYASDIPLLENLADLFKCGKEQIEQQFKDHCLTVNGFGETGEFHADV